MTQLAQPIKMNEIPDDDRQLGPIPAGVYNVQVIETGLVDTKSGSGQYLAITMEVIDGPYVNRRLWDRFNIVNDSEDAMRIAYQQLKQLTTQIGVDELHDTDDLCFKPFKVRVRIEKDKNGQYDDQNRMRYNVDSGQRTTPQQARPQAQKTQAPNGRPGQRQAPQRPAQQPGNRPWNKPQKAAPGSDAEPGLDDKPPF